MTQSQTSFSGKPKLLDQLRTFMRARRYSLRTEEAYLDWIRRFILFHGRRHPRDLGEREITEFLTDLAVHRHVAASTQNQALSALLFLYQQFFERKLGRLDDALRASRPARVPVVLTREEVRALLAHVAPTYRLIADLIYGSGLRLLEALRLRVKARKSFAHSPRMLRFVMHYVYVLRSTVDDGFYLGYSANLRRRFEQHSRGDAFATSYRGPWKVIYYEAYLEQADALGRERYLKSGAGRRFLKSQLKHYLRNHPSKRAA